MPTKKVYQQGNLDALCGIYCIVNILNAFHPFNKVQSTMLFIGMVKLIETSRPKPLSHTLKKGLKPKHMRLLIESFVEPRDIHCSIPFDDDVEPPTIDVFWEAMQDFMGEGGVRCILLRLSGCHQHLTIVDSMTSRLMYLRDSDKLQRIYRTSCSTDDESTALHIVWPSQTYFMKRK